MESLTKKAFLSSALSTVLFCTGITHAAPLNLLDGSVNNLAPSNYVFFSPKFPTEGQKLTNIFSSSHQQPFATPLTIKSQNVRHKSCRKKNELYEITAILNDKLQVLLSYFDEEPTYRLVDKPIDKEEIPLTSASL